MSKSYRPCAYLSIFVMSACVEPTPGDEVDGSETADCVPGTLDCECINLSCVGDLVCEAGVCSEADPTASGDGDGDGDGGDGDGAPGDGDGAPGDGDGAPGDGDGEPGDGDGDPGDGDGDGDPTPCEAAAAQHQSLGCEYLTTRLYTGNLNNFLSILEFGNPDPLLSANVAVDAFINGAWEPVATPFSVGPWQTKEVTLPAVEYAIRVQSDRPVGVQQFVPMGDASLSLGSAVLHDRATWDWDYFVFGLGVWVNDVHPTATAHIMTLTEGTTVTVVSPVVATITGLNLQGIDVPAWQPTEIEVPVGKVASLEVKTANAMDSLIGTRLTSDASHPFAVIAENPSGSVPTQRGGDHTVEQLIGVHQWGTEYIAMRSPRYSDFGQADAAYWQIVASEDNTMVSFATVGSGTVSGLPAPQLIHTGQVLAFLADGNDPSTPGSFTISASKPVGVAAYITAELSNRGPSFTMLPPQDALPQVVIFNQPTSLPLPNASYYQIAVAHPDGAAITFDGTALAANVQYPIAPGWTASHYSTTPTTLVIEGDQPFLSLFTGADGKGDNYLTLGGFDGK